MIAGGSMKPKSLNLCSKLLSHIDHEGQRDHPDEVFALGTAGLRSGYLYGVYI